MDFQKFTENSLNSLKVAETIAKENNNPDIGQPHILYGLLTISESLIYELIEGMKVNVNFFVKDVEEIIKKLPKVSGNLGQMYMSANAVKVLDESLAVAQHMKDEYISVEHIFLAFLENAESKIGEIFKKYKITKQNFLQELKNIRGNTKVVNHDRII